MNMWEGPNCYKCKYELWGLHASVCKKHNMDCLYARRDVYTFVRGIYTELCGPTGKFYKEKGGHHE